MKDALLKTVLVNVVQRKKYILVQKDKLLASDNEDVKLF